VLSTAEAERRDLTISQQPDLPGDTRFIGAVITVDFDQLPMLSKSPSCPDRFVWEGVVYEIIDLVAEWRDFRRRGRMAKNMKPTHLSIAAQRGSWGVGRYYFRVLTGQGRLFDVYYDRAPQSIDVRKGGWFLYRELVEEAK